MAPAVFTALGAFFAVDVHPGALAYPLYGLSAYCLVLFILPLPQMIRRAKAQFLQWMNASAFGRNYADDPAFRGSVSLCCGTVVDFCYAAFRIVTGVRYGSVWFLSIAVYYLILGGLRLSLILNLRRGNRADESRCYRRTARLLFLLNVPMGGMILLMVLTDSGYFYPGYVIYLSAIYTFCMMTISIVNLVKSRRLGSPIFSAAKILNFIAALMSILGLQTAMIARFSPESAIFRNRMNAITGGCVWAAVILIALYMLHQKDGRGGMSS